MPTKLKLNGKPLDLHPLKPTAAKIAAFLDKAPHDELYTLDELAAKMGVHERTIYSQRELGESYTHKSGTKRYFGNPKAIAELRRQVAA